MARIKRPSLLFFFLFFVVIAGGWLVLNPFLSKQSIDVLDIRFDYPKCWYHSFITTKTGAFEGLIISNVKNIRTLQDAPTQGSKAEVTITVVPKEKLENYKKSFISQLSPVSKIDSVETKIDGYDAIIITIDGMNTDNFYSKQITVFLDAKSGVYKIQGGVLRGTKSVESSYYYKIVENIINSIRFK